MRKLLTGILCGAAAGLALVFLEDTLLSPGQVYFKRGLECSGQWAERLRAEGDAPCYILEGSSDVRMGVDPAAMREENGTRAVNAAVNAGNGGNVNLMQAIRLSRPGDTIVSFPLSPWNDPRKMPQSSLKSAFITQGADMFEKGLVEPSLDNFRALLRGNMANICYVLGKLALGFEQVYKYNGSSRIHESGWAEVHTYPERVFLIHRAFKKDRIEPEDAIVDVLKTAAKCKELGLGLVVQIPREYAQDSMRAKGLYHALYLVRQGIDVLRDPAAGVETDIGKMADTYYHLNGEGAKEYSRLIARLLAAKEYWTEAELVEKLREMGWKDDGTRLPGAEAKPAMP